MEKSGQLAAPTAIPLVKAQRCLFNGTQGGVSGEEKILSRAGIRTQDRPVGRLDSILTATKRVRVFFTTVKCLCL
jgi:hypothetical protein